MAHRRLGVGERRTLIVDPLNYVIERPLRPPLNVWFLEDRGTAVGRLRPVADAESSRSRAGANLWIYGSVGGSLNRIIRPEDFAPRPLLLAGQLLLGVYRGDAAAPNRGLLLKMLGICFELPVWQRGGAQSQLADDLLTIVIRAFLDEAFSQVRQGPLKSYVHRDETLTRPRGRLNLAEQVRRGRAQAHPLYCEFDEFTADNAFNQAMKAALLIATPWLPIGSTLKASADQLFVLLGEISTARMNASDIAALPRNRLTERYEWLLTLSAWIVRLLGPDVRGGDEQGLSLLFDMNRLFQEYVSRMLLRAIRQHPKGRRLRLSWERPVKPLLKDETGIPRFMLRPDLCLWCDQQIIAILDTKWKQLDPKEDESKAGIAQSDIYQLLAYGHTYQCQRLALIYPLHAGLSGWVTPSYRFAPHDASATGLSVRVFDLDRAEASAIELLAAHFGQANECVSLPQSVSLNGDAVTRGLR